MIQMWEVTRGEYAVKCDSCQNFAGETGDAIHPVFPRFSLRQAARDYAVLQGFRIFRNFVAICKTCMERGESP